LLGQILARRAIGHRHGAVGQTERVGAAGRVALEDLGQLPAGVVAAEEDVADAPRRQAPAGDQHLGVLIVAARAGGEPGPRGLLLHEAALAVGVCDVPGDHDTGFAGVHGFARVTVAVPFEVLGRAARHGHPHRVALAVAAGIPAVLR